ncbi:Phospholipase/Carboxylesterase [alpha proteobacterium HIMB59]|nr:Phospholipase/Carboxylesterase [alpha proteobacterium HIMB59]
MKKIVLFLHGYGSNGSDLISLKDYFHLNQSETEFISPNAPEPCEFNFFGYQWFALRERSEEEIQAGLKSAFFYLDEIVNDIKKKFQINSDQISILGFSQGSMLATYYALQNEDTFQNIFSLSGSLPKKILEEIELKKNNTKYLIFHGKIDDVVSPNQAIETHSFLSDQKIKSQLIMDDNCGHSISPLAIEAINNQFKNWI